MSTKSLTANGKSLWMVVVAITSLVATPLLIFLSSSIALYMMNREEMLFRHDVLLPFFVLFTLTLIGACLIFLLLRKSENKYFQWSYYLLGPLFIFYSFVKNSPLSISMNFVICLFTLGAFAWLVIILNRKVDPRNLISYIALVSVALVCLEGFNFSTVLSVEETIDSRNLLENRAESAGSDIHSADLPNVYHIVFDEYQSDMFSLTLSPEVQEELGGFAFFPEATTPFGRTRMSLASMLRGRSYDFNSSQLEFQRAAYESQDSLLYVLKETGYQTTAYAHKAFMKTLRRSLFDEVICQQDYCSVTFEDFDALFFRLWIYAYIPDFLARRLAKGRELEQLANQNLLGRSGAIISVHAWRRFLKEERQNPSKGRYVFAHLMVPHFPYVLDANCDYGSEDEESTPLEQSLCATRLVVNFVEMLKEVDRFTESLIIIQGDHGARFKVEEGALKRLSHSGPESIDWSKARARTLLMIKPSGVSDTDGLVISPAEATVMDIAPSIVSCLGLETDMEFEGTSLVNPIVTELQRIRYFHFFEKKARHEWTDAMDRYRIEGNEVYFEGTVSIKNNPDPSKPPS